MPTTANLKNPNYAELAKQLTSSHTNANLKTIYVCEVAMMGNDITVNNNAHTRATSYVNKISALRTFRKIILKRKQVKSESSLRRSVEEEVVQIYAAVDKVAR